MKKLIALLAVAVGVMPAAPAMAAVDQAAIITKDGLCGGAVPDGAGGFGDIILSSSSHSVVTSSGISTLKCHFDLDESMTPPTSRRASGFLCGTYLGPTTDTRIVASPGGRMILTCRVRKPKP